MPSQPLDTGWDFSPVLDLISSDSSADPPELYNNEQDSLVPISRRNALQDKASHQSLRLGNFGKLFAELGISDNGSAAPLSPVEPDSEGSSSSSDSRPAPISSPSKKASTAKKEAVKPTDATKKVTSLVPKAPNQDDAIPQLPPRRNEGPTMAGLSRRQRQRARKMQMEMEHANKTKQSPPTPKVILRNQSQQDKPHATRALSKESTKSNHSARKESEAKHQISTPSKSNVGAKIRSTTPEQAPAPTVLPTHSQNPSATTSAPSIPFQPAVSTAHTGLDDAFSFNQSQYVSSIQPEFEYFPITNPTLIPGHLAVPSPMVPRHVLTPPHPNPNMYHTPQTQKPTMHTHGLIPRTVQPVLMKRSQPSFTPQQQTQQSQHAVAYPQSMHTPLATPGKLYVPLTIRPKIDRNFHFFNQLLANFPEELAWLVSPMQLCNEKKAPQGIHVFVDASNILIGFQWTMKKYRVAPFEMSFDSLALLMERRRPVAKRVFAGSHREANPVPYVKKLHEVSRAVGYENMIKEQVLICREDTERKKFFKDVEKMGFQKAVAKAKRGSGSGSDSETGAADAGAGAAPLTPSAPRWVEQGVDEILHLKMCQSIIDTEVPTTMVLATGDGAEAEHSDGFLAHVERALKKGWKIELVSWRQQTNGGYRNKKFRAKWGDQFKIIELDDYLEALIDTP